jgi:non-heme chloroperoxidase
MIQFIDDDLNAFASNGPPSLPPSDNYINSRGVAVWFGDYGAGPAVVLAHGGMGNANNFGHQVPALVAAGHRVIAVDTRGHGRSGWDGAPFSYIQFAEDILAALDHLQIARAAVVGWSDGACTGLALAKAHPERVTGVFFFACNVDASGARPFAMTDVIGNCLVRHRKDYAALSPAPDNFDEMSAALQEMQASQPNYSSADLGAISVPVTVAWTAKDEFIRPDHARYIAKAIPNARLVELPDVSHFAPVQRPEVFNEAVLEFSKSIKHRAA